MGEVGEPASKALPERVERAMKVVSLKTKRNSLSEECEQLLMDALTRVRTGEVVAAAIAEV